MAKEFQTSAFTDERKARVQRLILPRLLREEASKKPLRTEDIQARDRAHEIIRHWADLEAQGTLKTKESSLDAEFLNEVFGQALGYRATTDSPEAFELRREFHITKVGDVDGALGRFTPHGDESPTAVIELKGSAIDLDKHRSNGRTAVQQCWDYLNSLPGCPWGIVSNFSLIRLYHRDKTPQAYEEFRLQDLRNRRAFEEFYCLLEIGGLLGTSSAPVPRAARLLELTDKRQRDVGNELYDNYSENRVHLIENLISEHGKSFEQALFTAQRLLDRIIFIAFCEDRGLMPADSIDKAYSTIPPFSKVTNPRWQNFLNLFYAVDKGHNDLLGAKDGYNGGLFRHDPEIDELQLDDSKTNFFRSIGRYDFRDEVNVDVLGNIFERSVSDIEHMRQFGIFHSVQPYRVGALAKMPKSPERKRQGTYYTPPDFTSFIVTETILPVVQRRFEQLRKELKVTVKQADSKKPNKLAAQYWKACFEVLQEIKVCDPACGSGAFLIQAYDALYAEYLQVSDHIEFHSKKSAEELRSQIPERILSHNLYGVDLSPQAVEISQLALWIRSARKGVTLADLSQNIRCGNSLIADEQVDPRAFDWKASFPDILDRPEHPGFDCVIGNPPWERMKLQEREFFAFTAPEIGNAVSAATRRKAIATLERTNPPLFEKYQTAQTAAGKALDYARRGGAYPLTGKGDINTYMLFAELAQKIVAPSGRVGLLIPSGIATDMTTKEFFAQLVDQERLIKFFDFENRKKIFPDIDGRMKFAILIFGGKSTTVTESNFIFFAHQISDLEKVNRHILLTAKDFKLLNPNTKTCPIFRTRRDAELTKTIYRRVPVLHDRTRKSGGNPWGIKFMRMFDQTNDAELFTTREELTRKKYRGEGNRWIKGKRVFLPLYEAKMVQAYDHRAASVILATDNWVRQGQTEPTSLVGHQNPEFTVQPRWWVDKEHVASELKSAEEVVSLGFKDITSPTNQRTMIASFIPYAALTNHCPLILTSQSKRLEACLLANLNSIVFDYATRQKIGGVTLNFFIVEQLPAFAPDAYAEKCPWKKNTTLEKWVSERVLKLSCTAHDMLPLAEATRFKPKLQKWNPRQRAELSAELDAGFFLLYGLSREDAAYVLDTFNFARDESSLVKEYAELVLTYYDTLTGQA